MARKKIQIIEQEQEQEKGTQPPPLPTREEVALARDQTLAAIAALEDSPRAFSAFYRLVHGQRLPPHAMHWIESVYQARAEGRGTVIEAFRGSTKTTTMTITFAAWRIGKEPQRANLLIQVGDDIAADNTAQIADLIANSIAWKMVFPHVVPDRERGWGAGGYEVKVEGMDYAQWRALCSERKDPTLVGVGYKSREIIGKHPDGMLIVDDIHDENNTSSERELSTVRKILTGTIFPTMTGNTWAVFIGTPWVENDCLRYAVSTGQFAHVVTPVYQDTDTLERVYSWPEKFGEAEVERQRSLAGKIEFARMFLLDLTAAQNRVFRYQTYPASQIKAAQWPMYGGVDYASSADAYKNKEGKGDYFAFVYVAKLPGGGAVVYDGVIDHCTQAQAESYVVRAQDIFPGWILSAVESVGKGDDFVQVISRNPSLRIRPMHSGKVKKERRLEIELSPWLENGMVKVSDAETPFLLELRRELDNYPFHDHDDAMDALYYALRLMPDVLRMPKEEDELPTVFEKRAVPHPAVALGRR